MRRSAGSARRRGVGGAVRRRALALALALAAAAVAADPTALSDQALELAQQKRFAEAAQLWNQALELDPDFFPALFNLGLMNVQQGKFSAGESFLAKAAAADKKDFNSRYLLGLARSKQEKRDEALRAWREALAIQPNQVKLMQVMSVEYGIGRYHLEAAALAERAMRLNPKDPALHFLAITAYRQAGELEKGREVARLAAGRFPDSARAQFEYGWHLLKAGEYDAALPLIKKAMELDPDYEEPYFYYGDWLVNQGRYEEAAPLLRRAIEILPGYIPARVRLGRALMGSGKLEDAVVELAKAVEQEPRHPQPHLLLSQIYFRQKDLKKAAAAKRESLRLRRENPKYLEAEQTRPFPD